ncbi:MAG: hypothetical protein K6A80_04015 [Saccharofermentans sp.]|nr:hypothetical protein [Saccharofermentans sp.]
MSQRVLLRERWEQHKPKNDISKFEDKTVAQAATRVMDYILTRFNYSFDWESSQDGIVYDLEYSPEIKLVDMIKFICNRGYRKWEDFDHSFDDKEIKPDGGVIYLLKIRINEIVDDGGNKSEDFEIIERFPLVIAEVKHQGTNDKRAEEGKSAQATGNAIERLGKNLTGIKAMMHYESITPFICFGDGCDFMLDSETEMLRDYYKEAAEKFAEDMSDKCCNEISSLDPKKASSSSKVIQIIKKAFYDFAKKNDNLKKSDIYKDTVMLALAEDLTSQFVASQDASLFRTEETKNRLKEVCIDTIINRLRNSSRTVRAKVFTLNEFYSLNRVTVFKKDKSLDDGAFAPTSMMFRYSPWTEDEMYDHMKEIAETSFRYYTM